MSRGPVDNLSVFVISALFLTLVKKAILETINVEVQSIVIKSNLDSEVVIKTV